MVQGSGGPVRFAVAGVGNCASALLQCIWAAESDDSKDGGVGIAYPLIGGLTIGDLQCVTAFDVDSRKVGKRLDEAVFAPPNCVAPRGGQVDDGGVRVQMGVVADGVAPHMQDYPAASAFRLADAPSTDLVEALRRDRVEVLVCYLPVGSEAAVRVYAEACLEAGVAMVNCVPVFLASDVGFAERFRMAGVPLVGDDIKSQFGATILHRRIMKLLADRGCSIDRSYQLNVGGNTDFLNMLARDRLVSKKRSKTNAVQAVLPAAMPDDDLHIGPSDYVPWLGDNKVALIRVEARGFGGARIELDARLSVEDSPNSAGVVIDALRCAALALRRGEGGPLGTVCAYAMKSPPVQADDDVAIGAFRELVSAEATRFEAAGD